MKVTNSLRLPVLSACLLIDLLALGQKPPLRPSSTVQSIPLNVEVEDKNGAPVQGLTQNDFTILDNNSRATATSFRAVTQHQEPVHVIIVIDAVNIGFDTVAYTRDQVRRFLAKEGGALQVPTALAVFTDKGMQIQEHFTTDGRSLSDWLGHNAIGLRTVSRAAGFWGADERLSYSWNGLAELIKVFAPVPGRKAILWISPGWPILTGPNIYLSKEQQQSIFQQVVSFSTDILRNNITLYNLNPLGAREPLLRTNYYQTFLKGISSPGQAQVGDLALQVIAVQSGGLALESSTDVEGELRRCMKDFGSWYEIALNPPASEKRPEYHQLRISVDRPGVTARSRTGYYLTR